MEQGNDDEAESVQSKPNVAVDVSAGSDNSSGPQSDDNGQSPVSQARSPSDENGDAVVEEAQSAKQEEKEEKDEDQKEEKSQANDAEDAEDQNDEDGNDGNDGNDEDEDQQNVISAADPVNEEQEAQSEQNTDDQAESKDDGDKEEKDADQAQQDVVDIPQDANAQNADSAESVVADDAEQNEASSPQNVEETESAAAPKPEVKPEVESKENGDAEKAEKATDSVDTEKSKDSAESNTERESEQKESVELKEETEDLRVFSIEEQIEMTEFFENVSSSSIWTMQKDAALLRAAAQVASSVDLPVWSLLSTDLKNFNIFKMANELEADPRITFKAVTQRFILLKLFNRALSFVLPFISFDLKYAMKAMLGQDSNGDIERGAIYNYGAEICRHLFLMKPLIFGDLKNNLLSELIAVTNTPTKANDDPYEDPPSLKKVTINRHKARKAMELYLASESVAKETVLRHSMFKQLFLQLKWLKAEELRRNYVAKLDDGQERTFKVKFFGEGVQDNGGPYRETFHELIDEVFNEQQILPLFIKSPNFRESDGIVQDKFVPNPSSSSAADLELFAFFGQMIGVCVRNHILINFNLSSIVWKQLIGPQLNAITLEGDIAEIDEGFVRQYKFVDTIQDGDDAVDLSYIHFVFKRCDGSEIELVPNGRNITLTLQNRSNYLKLMLHHKIHEFDDQIAAIRRGLSAIVPLHLLPLYTHSEFEHVVCGDSDFSVDLLKSVTVYEGHLSPSAFHVKMFWAMMRSLTPSEKEMFLRFTWAKTRMPGKKSMFKGNKFKLQPYSLSASGGGDSHNVDMLLPRSHTCFFSLQLPPYSAMEIMKERFLYAFNNTASMDRDLKLQDSELYDYQKDDI